MALWENLYWEKFRKTHYLFKKDLFRKTHYFVRGKKSLGKPVAVLGKTYSYSDRRVLFLVCREALAWSLVS